MKRKQFVEGQLVRVGRDYFHGIKFGAVCRVLRVYGDGDIEVAGPVIEGQCWDVRGQNVDGSKCRHAKQATKKQGS